MASKAVELEGRACEHEPPEIPVGVNDHGARLPGKTWRHGDLRQGLPRMTKACMIQAVTPQAPLPPCRHRQGSRWRRVYLGFWVWTGLAAAQAQTASPASKAPTEPEAAELYDLGKKLFDEYAPAEIKAEYEFPSIEQWNSFAGKLQAALQGDSLQDMAASEGEVRRTLAQLQKSAEGQDYVDWLKERLDLIESARDALKPQPPSRPVTPPKPPGPEATKPVAPAAPVVSGVPHYDLWLRRVQARPVPPKAEDVLPRLKEIFREQGLPTELAWVAEVESSFNPSAKSPAGARGLYQLMPDTARSLGLSLFPFDERAQPEKNARAAAQLLRQLHQRFRSWPLALAAYNAGPGRVGRALEKVPQGKFGDIASTLPAETRMYVPKVLATVAVREKITPTALVER